MQRDDILKDVEKLCQEIFDNDQLSIDEKISADDIEEWDSFAHVSLIIALQNFFKIKFALGELQDIQNIGGLITLVQLKLDAT